MDLNKEVIAETEMIILKTNSLNMTIIKAFLVLATTARVEKHCQNF